MRKAITLIAVTAIAAVLGAGLVSASSKEPSISAARDIHLVARATEQNFVDTGDPGPSLGDMFVFRERLSSEGQRVGHDGGVCTLTSKRMELSCEVTVQLEGGQVASQGLISEQGPEPHTFVIPITGGSGIYRNVRGQARVRELTQKVSRITLHLIP
jgi:hypothetical protein